MSTPPAEDYVMKSDSKIKLSEDDFVLVGMNYNYYMIPRLASVWNNGVHGMYADDVAGIMEKYFGKRIE
jgi:hypothetical protein